VLTEINTDYRKLTRVVERYHCRMCLKKLRFYKTQAIGIGRCCQRLQGAIGPIPDYLRARAAERKVRKLEKERAQRALVRMRRRLRVFRRVRLARPVPLQVYVNAHPTT
jgi:hypothetical protein